jgi:hypothetical protein
MVKIRIGSPKDNSKQHVQLTHTADARTEIDIGGARGRALQRVVIDEVTAARVLEGISVLQRQIHVAATRSKLDASVLDRARVIAEQANRAVRERKWYDVSAEGLLEAAKAVGQIASPLVASAVKVVELLSQAGR